MMQTRQQSSSSEITFIRDNKMIRMTHGDEDGESGNGRVYEAGEHIPGFPGYRVPEGFRARVVPFNDEEDDEEYNYIDDDQNYF